VPETNYVFGFYNANLAPTISILQQHLVYQVYCWFFKGANSMKHNTKLVVLTRKLQTVTSTLPHHKHFSGCTLQDSTIP